MRILNATKNAQPARPESTSYQIRRWMLGLAPRGSERVRHEVPDDVENTTTVSTARAVDKSDRFRRSRVRKTSTSLQSLSASSALSSSLNTASADSRPPAIGDTTTQLRHAKQSSQILS